MVLPAPADTDPVSTLVRFVYTRADSDALRAVRPSIVQITFAAWGNVNIIEKLIVAQVAFTLSIWRGRETRPPACNLRPAPDRRLLVSNVMCPESLADVFVGSGHTIVTLEGGKPRAIPSVLTMRDQQHGAMYASVCRDSASHAAECEWLGRALAVGH